MPVPNYESKFETRHGRCVYPSEMEEARFELATVDFAKPEELRKPARKEHHLHVAVSKARKAGPAMIDFLISVVENKRYPIKERRGAAEQVLKWGYGPPAHATVIFNKVENNIHEAEKPHTQAGDDLLDNTALDALKKMTPEKQTQFFLEMASVLAQATGVKAENDAELTPVSLAEVTSELPDPANDTPEPVQNKSDIELTRDDNKPGSYFRIG